MCAIMGTRFGEVPQSLSYMAKYNKCHVGRIYRVGRYDVTGLVLLGITFPFPFRR